MGNNFGTHIDAWLQIHAGIQPSTGHYVTFNAVSSAATIMFGVLAGNLLRGGLSAAQKVLILLATGLGGLTLGWFLAGGDMWLPISFPTVVPMVKRLWTASFAIFAGGWTCVGRADDLAEPGNRRAVRVGVVVLVDGVVGDDRHVAGLPVVAHPVVNFEALAVKDVEDRFVHVKVHLRPAAGGVLLEVEV